MFNPFDFFKLTIFGNATGMYLIKIVRNLKYRLLIVVYLCMIAYIGHKGERLHCLLSDPKDEKP